MLMILISFRNTEVFLKLITNIEMFLIGWMIMI